MNKFILEEKKRLRQEVFLQRQNYDVSQLDELSIEIIRKIEINQNFIEAKNILCYWPINGEVNITGFINKWKSHKEIFLPIVKGDDLHIGRFTTENEMVKGEQFKIMEPKECGLDEFSAIQLAIIPGVAFDKNGNRLGRGRGYYDRLLSKMENTFKMGVCFPFQMFDNVPVSSVDIKMDEVVTVFG